MTLDKNRRRHYTINTMKIRFNAVFVVLFGFAVTPCLLSFAQEFTEEENAAIQLCESNITDKIYSPKNAETCVTALHKDDDRLLEKLKQKDEAENTTKLPFILKHEEMFKELGQFYSSDLRLDNGGRCVIRKKMIKLFDFDNEAKACSLCELGLGPQPDRFLPWVQTYANKLYITTEFSMYEWDTLNYFSECKKKLFGGYDCTKYTVSLSSQGYSEETWKMKTVNRRMAAIIADDVLTGRNPDFMDTENARCSMIQAPLKDFLEHYLDPEMRTKLWAYLDKIKEAKTADTLNTGIKKSSDRISATSAKLAGINSDANSFSTLGQAFDGSNLSGAEPVPPPGSPAAGPVKRDKYTLTDDEASQLAVRLQGQLVGKKDDKTGAYSGGELKGTKVGDGLLSMYNAANKDGSSETPLKLKVIKYKSDSTGAAYCPQGLKTCGAMNPAPGEIALNKTMIEQWMKDKGVTAKELMDPKNDEYVQRLSKHVAPTFVHEATHQQDDKWARDHGLPYRYTLDDEVGTFSRQSLFLKEKLADPKTNALYMRDLRKFDNEVLQTAETGGARGIKQMIRYYNLHGIEGEASKSFTQLENALKEQNLRKTAKDYAFPKADSNNCWAGRPENCSNAQLDDMVSKTYPWYQQAMKKQRDNVTFIDTEMNRLNQADKSGRAKKLYPRGVPPLAVEGDS
ncbi:MAG: hypothetical protein NTX59_06700 [Elusimicrobia bacterium]|nr:hypothetical protein [Elusimicrobiota bacterium]